MFACEKIDLLLKTRYIPIIWVPLKLGHRIDTHTHTHFATCRYVYFLKIKTNTFWSKKKTHWTFFGCVDSSHSTQLLYI